MAGLQWAADNDCFQGLDERRWHHAGRDPAR
jgi:hypothetical protein